MMSTPHLQLRKSPFFQHRQGKALKTPTLAFLPLLGASAVGE